MLHRLLILTLALSLTTFACSSAPETAPEEAETAEAPAPPAPPQMLPLPFTAEEIQEEWQPGLTLVQLQRTDEGEKLERWTVLSADAEGAEIEFQPLDENRQPAGEANVQKSTWKQLESHGAFPANIAQRARATRTTPLGELEGWVYSVLDPQSGAVNLLFFADGMAGAPVQMETQRDGKVLMYVEQIERSEPEPADDGTTEGGDEDEGAADEEAA